VGDGDSAKVDSEYRSLLSRIDRAVKSGALHRNNGARKKARAARIRSRLS
jgi:small subunit ribosomal protein S20